MSGPPETAAVRSEQEYWSFPTVPQEGCDFSAGEVRERWPAFALRCDEAAFHYQDPQGREDLRSLFLSMVGVRTGATVSNVCVTAGAKHAIALAMHQLVWPGRTVLLPCPGWMPYLLLTKKLGGFVRTYHPSNVSDLLETAASHPGALLILNYPNNPTGQCLSKGELDAIVRVAEQYDLVVISDEVYRLLEPEHPTVASYGVDEGRLVLVDSVSKWAAAAGVRVGFLLGATHIVRGALESISLSVSGSGSLGQEWAVRALQDSSRLDAIRREVVRERSQLVDLIQSAGFHVISSGGLYAWVAGGPSLTFRDDVLVGAPGRHFGEGGASRFCASSNPRGLRELTSLHEARGEQ